MKRSISSCTVLVILYVDSRRTSYVPMNDIRIAAAQFEYRDGDPEFNLSRIRELTRRAVDDGADVVSFHECCISGYSFVQPYSAAQMREIAESVPDGPCDTNSVLPR